MSLLTGKIFPYSHCPWTMDIQTCGRIFLFIFILVLALNCLIYCQVFVFTPIAFLAHCMDPNFQLVVFSVVNNIWRVMIPYVCILYSKANPKDNARILGELFFII